MRGASTCLGAFGILFAVAGCGRVDSGATYFPEIIRDRAPKPAVPDPAPDVRTLLQSDLNAVFLAASAPTNVSFSVPKPSYAEWTTCVRALVSGAAGDSIGQQTIIVKIHQRRVNLRDRFNESHWCAAKRYEPL